MVGDLDVALALAIGGDHDRGAVLVGAADHQHVVAPEPVVAREHVGGDAEAGDVPEVAMAGGVGPGGRHEDLAAPCLHGAHHTKRPSAAPRAPGPGRSERAR